MITLTRLAYLFEREFTTGDLEKPAAACRTGLFIHVDMFTEEYLRHFTSLLLCFVEETCGCPTSS